MTSTLELMKHGLKQKPAAQWCRELNVTDSALSKAKREGHLSPRFAAYFAIKTGADPFYWSTLAIAEAEKDSDLKRELMRTLERHKTKL